MNRMIVFLFFLFTSVTAFAQDPSGIDLQLERSIQEIRRTVNTVVGRWEGEMTAMVPGMEAESFPWSLECTPVALESGASCVMKGFASIGPIAQGCILAYDPGGKKVHFMCVTSMGEVHDHQGQWNGLNEIEFEPFAGYVNGEPVQETVIWEFPDEQTIHTISIVAGPNKEPMKFTFVGKRKASKPGA